MIRLTLLCLVACSGQTLYKGAINWERYKAGLSLHATHVAGHEVPYLEGGSGETIVLVHGFGADKDAWLPFATQLVRDFHVISFDVPGFGDSSRIQDERYDIPNQVRRLEALMTALGVERAHIVGSSMGGAISAAYAIAYPARVASLLLIDAAGVTTPEKSEVRKMIEAGDNPLVVSDLASFDRFMSVNFVAPPKIPDSVKTFFVERSMQTRPFTEKIFADLTKPPVDLTAELGQISARTLVVWGDSDKVIHPSGAKVYAEGIKGAELFMVEKCGHAPAFERAVEVAARYKRFIGTAH